MEEKAGMDSHQPEAGGHEPGTRLTLPSDNATEWAQVMEILTLPLETLADLDTMLTKFSASDRDPKDCSFFASVPGTSAAGAFDFDAFFATGVPLIIEAAQQMPVLFEGVHVPIFKMRSSWAEPGTLGKRSLQLTRRQCACLLAHSFLGSLKRPADVQPNDFRFTVHELFLGPSAAAGVSANSATTFLNYWTVLGKRGGLDAIPEEMVTFHRWGFAKGHHDGRAIPPPWKWDDNPKPLCAVQLVDGSISDCAADRHAEFANAFIGGGVMTGDAAQEELQFLMQPELMVAMAVMCRMVDEEAIVIEGALQYSDTVGFGQDFQLVGEHDNQRRPGPPPTVCAMDAVRGGGIGFVLRDINKARIAFDGAVEIATGHWGCGAFGNNHDLMFLKQWLAASEAGASKMFYHDYSRNQSHHIFPLVRKLKNLTVGELYAFVVNNLTGQDVKSFSKLIADISIGRVEVPGELKSVAASQAQGELQVSDGSCSTESATSSHAAEAPPAPLTAVPDLGGSPNACATTDAEPVLGSSDADDLTVVATKDMSAETNYAVFSLEELQSGTPAGVRPNEKEKYLSDECFRSAFGMDKIAFTALPQWKQASAKKKVGIF